MLQDVHNEIAELRQANVELVARVNELQRMAHVVNGLMNRIEALELVAASRSAGGDAYPKIMATLNNCYALAPANMTSHSFKVIWEALYANGLRLDGPAQAQKIAVARALVAFGAKPSRDRKGRIYRGIVKRGV